MKKLTIIIKDGENIISSELDELLKELSDGEYNVEIKKKFEQRTLKQNAALHLWCNMMAQELTEKHIDKREFFEESYHLSWTPIAVKEDIWRNVQRSLLAKESTTKLSKIKEIDMIWDEINRIIIEKYKGNVEVPMFPSKESLTN